MLSWKFMARLRCISQLSQLRYMDVYIVMKSWGGTGGQGRLQEGHVPPLPLPGDATGNKHGNF